MERNERLEAIYSEFDAAAQGLCDDTGGILCEITSEYKGEEEERELKYRFAKIYYGSFICELVYTAHGTLSLINSILGCVVYADKSEDTIGVPLPLVTDFLDRDVTVPMCIPCISNAAGMKQAVCCIGSVIAQLMPQLVKLSPDSEKKEALTEFYRKELNTAFDMELELEQEKEIGEEQLTPYEIMRLEKRFYFDLITDRLTSGAFFQYMKGEKISPRQLKKITESKKSFGYEKRMARLWQSGQPYEIPDLSAISDGLQLYDSNGVQKPNLREFWTMFLSWFVLAIGIAPVYLLLYFAVQFFEKRGAEYVVSDPSAWIYTFLFAGITGMAVSYFTRLWFYRLLNKKQYDAYEEMDHVVNGAGADKLMRVILGMIVSASIVACVLLPMQNLKFTGGGLWDNSQLFSLQGTHYSYAEIERVYFKPEDQKQFFASYVIVLSSGKEINLFNLDDSLSYEEELTALMKEHGIKVEK
ncbi:MAG: hypothetical protein II828_04460 [Clostridia bacterium]|nr:hypothetical protein [Clostridia bacterium]